jgi:hypothetical protein
MWSIALLALALLPILVAGFGVVGSAVRWTLARLFSFARAPLPGNWPEALIRVVEDVALGAAVFPVLFLIATLLNLYIGVVVLVGVLGAALALFLLRLVVHRTGFGTPISGRLPRPGWVGGVLLVGFVAALAIRLASYAPFLVYAGNDIRFFTLITELVEAHGHYVASFGPFVQPGWNLTVDPHLRFSGSEAIFATLNAWVPWNTPQLVSAAVLDFGILLPLSAFVFIRAVFPNRSYWYPTFGALALGLLAAYPLFYQQWGGIDEQVNWFLLPVAFALLLRYVRSGERGGAELWLGGAVLGAAFIVNPYPIAYGAVFVVSLLIASALGRGAPALGRTVPRVIAFFAIGLVLVSPVLYQVFVGLSHANTVTPPGYAGWGEFQTAVILQAGNWNASALNLLTMHTGVWATAVFVLLGWAGLVLALRKEPLAVVLLGFAVGLLVLNSNGPYGIFWVQYPGWNFLYADRPLEWMFLPLAAGVGWLVATLFEAAIAPGLVPSPATNPPVPLRHRVVRVRGRPVALAPALVLVAIVVLAGLGTARLATDNSATVSWGSTLTPADIQGFQWLETHVSGNATVLVDGADAGTWIPEFTGLRVFPYPELIASPAVYEETLRFPAFFNTTEYGSALSFLQSYNISAAYWGPRNGYSDVPDISPGLFAAARPVLDFATAASICSPPNPNGSLWLSCDNDSVTLRGPVVMNVTEYHDGSLIGVTWIGIAENTSTTITLHENTPQYPGEWKILLSEIPLGRTDYEKGQVTIVVLYPEWLALEGAPPGVRATPMVGTVDQW